MSSFTDVWWHPHHIEYAFSLIRPQQWPGYVPVLPLHDVRTNQYYYREPAVEEQRLLYRKPVIGVPTNRDVLRDQPDLCPVTRPTGFHGRYFQKDGAPEFAYQGPLRDDLYWFERSTYQPRHEDPRLLSTRQVRAYRPTYKSIGSLSLWSSSE